MRRIVVDTNVLLSFLTDRDERQQRQADELFQKAVEGEVDLIVHQVVVVEMVHVLLNFYGVRQEDAALTVKDLLAMPGITPTHELAWPLVLELWPEKVPTFVDATLAAVASQGRYDSVATFDAKFSKQLRRLGLTSYWEKA
ncbi:MAG TPA: PIN domain-containing protein [Thermoanaerobaculia bacterium]|nr:PIN domain-containing protein [Thermoanaerobaculia bacterium]